MKTTFDLPETLVQEVKRIAKVRGTTAKEIVREALLRAVDSNVLIYAFLSDSEFHHQAESVVSALAIAATPWAIPWACVHEFYGVVTRRSLFPAGPSPVHVVAQLDEWFRSPSLQLLSESRNHWQTLAGLVGSSEITGPLIYDAKIAAICLDHGVSEFITVDRDFGRFTALKVRSLFD